MHVTATCPACQSEYQVDPSLRGKRMRCPNPICRTVFEVADEPMPTPAGNSTRDGSFDPSRVESPANESRSAPETSAAPRDVRTAPVSPLVPASPPKWSVPPPIRKGAAVAVAPARNEIDAFDFPGDEPSADEPGVKQTPPVSPPPTESPSSPPKKRRPLLWIVSSLLVIAAAATGIAVKQVGDRRQKLEHDLSTQATELYQQGDFPGAMRGFQQLQRDYPKSADADRYRFLAIFSELRTEIDAAADLAALADARAHALEFLDTFSESPHFKSREADAFDALLPLAKRLTQAAVETLDEGVLDQAKSAWQRTRSLATRSVAREDEYFNAAFAGAQATLIDRRLRQATLAAVRERIPTPTAAAVAEAQKVAIDAKLANDPEIAAALKSLREAHKASIVFVPPGPSIVSPADDSFPLLPLVSPQQDAKFARGENPVVALSSAGVLTAHRARTGELLWARRLGIDSRFPPIRLPGGEGEPPRFLAVANDGKSIVFIKGSRGETLWRHHLSAPAIAEPTIAMGHLLVPLTTGRVEDINLATGESNGSFQFDQPLTAGGVRLSESALVAFAGDAHCLYVINLTTRSCVHILETGHAAGSLVGPPIFVSGAGQKNWLVLTQAEPGPGIRLRPIPYPPEDAGKRIERDVHIKGSLSFPPRHDAETIFLATDEGTLHRIAIRQPGNGADPLLFPLTPTEIALDAPPRGQSTKSLVVHVDADNLWVVSAGRLQRLRQSFSPKAGPTVKSAWPRGVRIGEPLHAAHVHSDAEGTIFFLAAVDPDDGTNSLSAIDAESGRVFWRTQLDTRPRSGPFAIGGKIVWLDPQRVYLDTADKLTQASQAAIASLPIPTSPRGCLLPVGQSGKDESATVVGWSTTRPTLTLSELLVSDASLRSPREVALAAPPVGDPVGIASPPSEGALFVAMSNGTLARVSLASGTATSGPDWRSSGADPETLPHLVAVRSDFVVAANGKGGLVAFEWGKSWKEAAQWQPTGPPLVGPSVLVPGAEPKLLTVDAGGTLSLLDAVRLQPISRKDWSLKGRLTAGPFAVGDRAYVVVDGKRLVAFDLSRDGPAWEANFTSTVSLAPVLAGERLVVTDQGGNFWTFDPKTGANLTPEDRPALSVRANLVPAAAPLPLADGKLFVIWSDGAAGLIPLP